MNILQVHNYYRYRGGEDKYADTVNRTLSEAGRRLTLWSFDSKDIASYGLRRKLAIPMRFIRSAEADSRLEKLLETERFDAAIIHNLFPLISLSTLEVLKKHRVPVIKRLENYRFLCLNGIFLRGDIGMCDVCKNGNFLPGIVHRCYQDSFLHSLGMALPLMISKWRKRLFDAVDCFLAPSEFIREVFTAAGFPPGKIEVLPNFLDFDPVPAPREPGDYAVFIGRLSWEKGLGTLLKAAEQLPGLRLKILGDGPMAAELKETARSRGLTRVEFLGYTDGAAKKELISGARFLVFPSECYESFGYSVIEGFACGVPVLAAAVGGSRELISEGENGYLFEAGNVAQLREKMAHLSRLDASASAQMRENALRTATATYTREIGCKRLDALLEKTAAK